MFYYNALNLEQVSGGNKIKQGDFGSRFSYKLENEKNQELDTFDQAVAHINLVLDDKIVFTTTATVDKSTVTFNIDKAIPVGLYFLEIKIDDYIFPSDRQTIIFVQSGSVAYDLKDLVPNYDTNMTITSILSDLSQKGIDISDLKTKMNAIYDNALADHAEIIQVRDGLPSLDARLDGLDAKIVSIADGSPKGTFATLSALQSTYPDGTDGVFLVLENGHWYYYASGWKDGGVYQATGIADKSITPEKTTFINNALTFTLERGAVTNGVNSPSPSNARVRSSSIIKHDGEMYVVRKDTNYLVGVSTYKNGVYDGIDRGWIDEDVIEIPGKNELRISIRRRDNGDISDAEMLTIADGIEVKYKFQGASVADLDKVEQDIATVEQDIATVKGNITHNISLKSEEFVLGSVTGNTPVANTARARTKNMLRVFKGDVIKFQKDPTLVNYGISISDLNGVWRGVDYGWLNQPEFIIEEDSLILLTVRYVDNRTLDENMVKTLTENTFTIASTIKNYVDSELNNTNVQTTSNIKKNAAISSMLVEYGRIGGASYVFVRIPKTLNDGSKLVPKVVLTSRDGSLSGAKRSTLNYARDQDPVFTVNAGLFNVSTVEPVGQLIIDGVSLINTPMTSDNGVPIHPDECYPLAIDVNGNLTTYPRNANTADMIADGVKYAVTAWGKLVDNFQIATEDINNEIVHKGKYIRQSIGQYQNGDYCVCTVDMTRGPVTNEAGLSYEELAQIFVDKGVKFAYSLDGGGSAQTVLGKRQLNPIYEGADGRKVPTVIEFYIAQ
jgi:exopolysaccharide biosynthesis protein